EKDHAGERGRLIRCGSPEAWIVSGLQIRRAIAEWFVLEVLVRGTGSIIRMSQQSWYAGTVEVPIQFGVGEWAFAASRGTVQKRKGQTGKFVINLQLLLSR